MSLCGYCWIVAVLISFPLQQEAGDVTGQFIAAPPTCPGYTFTFTCIVGGTSGVTLWRVGGSSECILSHNTRSSPRPCGTGSPFTAAPGTGFGTSATSFSSTLSGTATSALNGTLVECFGPAFSRDTRNMIGNSTLQLLGLPSVPTLSCIQLSEDVSGSVNVTVSWTLSGGDSADSYLINITTNAPRTPYRGLLNITTTSATQYELSGFMAGYEYNITVRGVNCGGLVGKGSDSLAIRPQVPTTPITNVCAVYDTLNRTLQNIESMWKKLNPLTVSKDCANGQDIKAIYELSYTTVSGTLITTCVFDETGCSNGTCHHELQESTADSRCQPSVPRFSGESVIVSLTATNIVGRSPAVSRSISGGNVDLVVYINTTNTTGVFVECTFLEPGYNCTIDYGTDSSYTNLVYRDTSYTQGRMVIITLSQRFKGDTTYYYIVSAESSSQCVRMQGRFQTGCLLSDLVPTDAVRQCADNGFANTLPIPSGVACYNTTTEGSEAVYICDDGFHQDGAAARVCQSGGVWDGSIPQCLLDLGDHQGAMDSLNIGVAMGITAIVTGAIALIVGFLGGIFVYHCISNHQSQRCKPELSSHQQQQATVTPFQQTGPEYEEVVELRQNRAYELTKNIEVGANMGRNRPLISMPDSPTQADAKYDKPVPATNTDGKIELRTNMAYGPMQQ